jgi:hypothetical protein
LVIGYWLLVIGYWLFDDLDLAGFKTNHQSPITDHQSPMTNDKFDCTMDPSFGSIHAGTAEPFRVSPPEAVAYHF